MFSCILAADAFGQSSSAAAGFSLAYIFAAAALIAVLAIVLIGYKRGRRVQDAGGKKDARITRPAAKPSVPPVHEHNRTRYRPADLSIEAAYQHSSPLTAETARGRDAVAEKYRNAAIFGLLPISSFISLRPPTHAPELPVSDDPSLLAAIDEANDDSYVDDEVRELTLRVLAAFRNSNSVEALAHMAVFDISPFIRSRALLALADIDHESVFETLIIGGSDPSKEVQAAAARAMFKISFDRADAWTRAAHLGDPLRVSLIAKAAVDSGLAERSYERLIHLDTRIAYEAFAMMVLMIKGGETEHIFATLRKTKDENLKLALLHTMRVAEDEECLEKLAASLSEMSFSGEAARKAEALAERYSVAAV